MPVASPDVITLTDIEHDTLARVVRASTTAQRLVTRARIVLLAAAGTPNAVIAEQLALVVDTVRKWRHRWHESPGLAALGDAKRCGRPVRFTPVQVAQVKALACQPPEQAGAPLSRWTCPDLARQAVADGICPAACGGISAATIGRWLAQDALKPWQHQSWIFIRDPDFAVKAARVLDLYARTWDAVPLGPDEYVISADEKTSIQARCRCHPTLAPGVARMMRVSHDYHRRGARRPLDTDPEGRLIEIYFSIIQRKVLSPNDFTDLHVIEQRLAAFESRYNPSATPFNWKFTTTDLDGLLERLDRHQNATVNEPHPTRAA